MSNTVHCMKCKGKTGTSGARITITKGHRRLAGRCTRCGSKKSKFIASGKGFGDFLSKAVNLGKAAYNNPLGKAAIDWAANAGKDAAMKKLGGGKLRRRRGRATRVGRGIYAPGGRY